jgi:hypothetical protein
MRRYLPYPGASWAGPLTAVLLLVALGAGDTAWAQRGYEKKQRPTPTPTVNRTGDLQRAREEVYEGYARLFILAHVMTHVLGAGGVLPETINLDVFAAQPFLGETGDVYVYRGGARGDIMWPLVLPTPPHETPTPLPTDTPTPEPRPEVQATPTVTPSPTPTEVVPPPLKLQAVSIAGRARLVMIGDTMFTVGDEVDGAVIREIHKGYAKVEYFGKDFMVTAKGTVRPEDFSEEDLSFD